MSATIKIWPIGNMGNQMLQYMFALNVQRLTEGLEIFGHNIPSWGLSAPQSRDLSKYALRLRGHCLDAEHIALLIRKGIAHDIILKGLGFRLSNYATVDFYRNVFRRADVAASGYGNEHVVINVRGAEILGNVHPDYGPLPFSYFDAVIEESGLQPVFLGQIGDDFYSRALRQRYSNAEFVPSQGPVVDFEILRRSRHISVAVSTFSWLAAWLSEAEVIHYPLSGMLNPMQRPEIDLCPSSDSRYRFYEFTPSRWNASARDVEALWQPRVHRRLDGGEALRLRMKAANRVKLRFARQRINTNLRAYIGGLLHRACDMGVPDFG